MYRKLIYLAFILVANTMSAQQLAQYSQYMHNPLVYNPAYAGANGCINAGIDVRKQWLGFRGSPFTQSLFVEGRIGGNHGLGGIIFNDLAGAAGSLGAEVAYAYHVKSTEDMLLSLGLSVSVMQYSYNESSFVTDIPGDPLITYGMAREIKPDAAFGIWFERKDFYGGIGFRQLLSSTVPVGSMNFLKRHFFVYIIRHLEIKRRDLEFEPSLMLKAIENPLLSFDLSLKTIYNRRIIFGLSYRYTDAVVMIAGLKYRRFSFVYNYDLITSRLFLYNTGSHELFIGYSFCDLPRRNSSGKRYRPVSCPDFK